MSRKAKNARNGKNGKVEYAPAFMSPEWLKRYYEAEAELRERCKTKEGAREFLVETGIYTKTGRLTKHYR